MELHCESFGDTGPDVVVLHGLLGSSRNWRGRARELSDRFRVHLLDQRNHGRSPRAPEMTYRAMAGDALAALGRLGLESACWVGHSMGGKVAMQLALDHPATVERLVVVDIGAEPHDSDHAPLIDALLAVELDRHGSRAEVDRALAGRIEPAAVRAFLLQNAQRGDDGRLTWQPDLEVIREQLPYLRAGVEGEGSFSGPTLVVRGGRSDYVGPAQIEALRRRFPRARVATVRGAGHWVHADAPEAFTDLVRGFLSAS